MFFLTPTNSICVRSQQCWGSTCLCGMMEINDGNQWQWGWRMTEMIWLGNDDGVQWQWDWKKYFEVSVCLGMICLGNTLNLVLVHLCSRPSYRRGLESSSGGEPAIQVNMNEIPRSSKRSLMTEDKRHSWPTPRQRIRRDADGISGDPNELEGSLDENPMDYPSDLLHSSGSHCGKWKVEMAHKICNQSRTQHFDGSRGNYA